MIPRAKFAEINDALYREVGEREDVGEFVFKFAALPAGHDIDYALDVMMTRGISPELRKAVHIVVDASG